MKKYIYYIVWMGDGKTGTMTHERYDKILTVDHIKELGETIKRDMNLTQPALLVNFILLGEEEVGGSDA